MFLEIDLEFLSNYVLYHRTDLSVTELGLCLSFKLRIRKLDRDDCCKTFPGVFTLKLCIAVLDVFILLCIVVDRTCHCGSEASEMRTAFRCCDVVCICVNGFLIGIVVLQSDLNEAVSLLSSKIDRRNIDSFLVSVEIFNEGNDTAVIVKMLLNGLCSAVIGKIDSNFLIKKSHFAVTCDH